MVVLVGVGDPEDHRHLGVEGIAVGGGVEEQAIDPGSQPVAAEQVGHPAIVVGGGGGEVGVAAVVDELERHRHPRRRPALDGVEDVGADRCHSV